MSYLNMNNPELVATLNRRDAVIEILEDDVAAARREIERFSLDLAERDATIARLRSALSTATKAIEADRAALITTHSIDGKTIPSNDTHGLSGLAEYDATLARIREAATAQEQS